MPVLFVKWELLGQGLHWQVAAGQAGADPAQGEGSVEGAAGQSAGFVCPWLSIPSLCSSSAVINVYRVYLYIYIYFYIYIYIFLNSL